MKTYYSLILFLLICVSCTRKDVADVESSFEPQIDQMIAKMTLEQKVGQTCQITLDCILAKDENGGIVEPLSIDTAKLNEAVYNYHVGSMLNVGWRTQSLDEWKMVLDQVHAPFKNGSVSIPIIYGIDAIHGVNYTKEATLFPQEIALAASWDTSLAQQFGEIVAYETRASGLAWNFSPVLDIGRQPLWSRHFETLGEDVYLSSTMGTAIVKGYQGNSSNKIGPNAVAACLKHYVGYSGTKSGRDRTPAWIPDKHMKELYLPAFKKAVEAGAQTLMINSGDVNGIPGHANYHLLTEVLKEEWGFDGFTVSDWEDFIMLHTVHRTAENHYEAIIQAINAGVDMSMVPLSPQYKEYCTLMKKAVEDNRISMERLDDAVRRILRVKYRLGLFDDNMGQAEAYPDFASEASKKAAEMAALQSITLLENKNTTLPLNMNQTVLVAGATSDDLIFLNGSWTHTWQGDNPMFNTEDCLNFRQAMENKNPGKILFSKGASVGMKDGFEESTLDDLADFKAKAAKSDIIVLCVGEFPSTEKPGDIRSLNLGQAQLDLANAAYETGKPVVLVLLEGRPRIIRTIVDKASAIVQAYLPGDYGAPALVKLLYGDANFAGRLPYSYPKYDGIIEFYDRPRSVDRAKSNQFDAFDPQWPFGHGLSYTEVVYSNLQVSDTSMDASSSLDVMVTVENKGDMAVDEIIPLYIKDQYASVVPSGKRLKRFCKINLAPEEIKTISFTLNPSDLSFVNSAGDWTVEIGTFSVSIDTLTLEFEFE